MTHLHVHFLWQTVNIACSKHAKQSRPTMCTTVDLYFGVGVPHVADDGAVLHAELHVFPRDHVAIPRDRHHCKRGCSFNQVYRLCIYNLDLLNYNLLVILRGEVRIRLCKRGKPSEQTYLCRPSSTPAPPSERGTHPSSPNSIFEIFLSFFTVGKSRRNNNSYWKGRDEQVQYSLYGFYYIRTCWYLYENIAALH